MFSALSLCKILKRFLEWILRCVRFCTQNGLQLFHFGAKVSLVKLFSHYCHLCLLIVSYHQAKCQKNHQIGFISYHCVKFQKIPQIGFQGKGVQYDFGPGEKITYFGAKKSLQGTHQCHFCLLIVPSYCEKFQKDHWSRFQEKGA